MSHKQPPKYTLACSFVQHMTFFGFAKQLHFYFIREHLRRMIM